MFSHDRSPEGPGAFRLTPDCEVVQAEIAALVAALCARGAAEDEGRRARFLLAVRRIRQHLRDHLEGVEGVAGLFDAIALGAAQLMPQLTTLCEEHAEMEHCLEELERRLEGPDTPGMRSPAVAADIRQAAAALGEVLRRHEASTCRLARSAGGSRGAPAAASRARHESQPERRETCLPM
ncbi:MAG TPA: hemerythrin domain-containing protein [Tepidisphaeraceae bacterium]|nr:hemerythrin domain-containing protein [Tepidisphaeraceae bacterium]